MTTDVTGLISCRDVLAYKRSSETTRSAPLSFALLFFMTDIKATTIKLQKGSM